MKRILRALGTASLALMLALPQVQAASVSRQTTNSSSLFASSLSCHYQGEPDCINIVTTITHDGLSGTGRFCVAIDDNRDTHPPLANGCVDLSSGQIIVDDTQAIVQPAVDVPAVYTSDCYMAAPEEGCVPETLTLNASAAFSAIGVPVSYRSILRDSSGPCLTTQFVNGTRVDVIGSVTIDGFDYDISGASPDIHHFEASLVTESVRTTVKCTGDNS